MATAALLALPCTAWSLDEAAATASALQSASGENALSQLEVTTSTLPRFDALESAKRASSIDLSLLSPGRTSVGVSMGLTNIDPVAVPPVSPQFSGSTSVDLGVRWRYAGSGNTRVDVTAWRRVPQTNAAVLIQQRDPSYGARVEMRLGSGSRHGFVADKGFLGFQLEGGGRLTLRRSGHAPMVYYRNTF